MRLIYNFVLIVIGIPLFAITFSLIIIPFIASNDKWISFLYAFIIWVVLIVIFSLLYKKRTKWFEDKGIFGSWKNFKVYILEGHNLPKNSQQKYNEFISWANLTEKCPKNFITEAKKIYNRIKINIKSKKQQKIYIKSLAYYTTNSSLPNFSTLSKNKQKREKQDDKEIKFLYHNADILLSLYNYRGLFGKITFLFHGWNEERNQRYKENIHRQIQDILLKMIDIDEKSTLVSEIRKKLRNILYNTNKE